MIDLERHRRVANRRALLKAKGLTYDDFGFDKSLVCRVFQEQRTSRKVQVRIARKLKVKVAELFPSPSNIQRGSAKRNKGAGR